MDYRSIMILISDFSHWKIREYSLLAAMLIVQIVAYAIHPTNLITLIGALCGSTCVVLTAKGKVSNYLFGFTSSVVIFYFAIQAKVFAEMPLQIFYMVIDVVSVFLWFKLSGKKTGEVDRTFKFKGMKKFIPVSWWAMLTLAAYMIVSRLGDAQPVLDAVTAGIGATAMILQMLRFRESFFLWIISNVLSMILWIRAGQYTGGNFTIGILYLLYTINSLYGAWNWTKLSHKKQAKGIDTND